VRSQRIFRAQRSSRKSSALPGSHQSESHQRPSGGFFLKEKPLGRYGSL
jgi:hypothetical protein